jgi:hypothetical protein
MIVKRLAPLSCAKITGLLYLIVGFIFGGVSSVSWFVQGLVGLVSGFFAKMVGRIQIDVE